MAMNSGDTLQQGYKLHWYTIESVLGRGGFGITYLAMDENLNQKVAIKEYLPSDFASRDEDQTVHPTTGEQDEIYGWGLGRFLKEAKILAQFKHPNIVRVLSIFEQNNTAYMVMEYEQGQDLAQILKARTAPLSEQELLNIYVPILEGLALVHGEGFIHRDAKPGNIYIRDDGSPVLIDFGSARQTVGSKTRALTSLVTYGYAPFEQYNENGGKQGAWTDLYSLAASMHLAMCGKLPLDALDRASQLFNDDHDPYIPLSLMVAGKYSPHFLLAIDNALMLRAQDRPQHALQWADMLTGDLQAPELPAEMLRSPAFDEDDATVILPSGHHSQRKNSYVRRETQQPITAGTPRYQTTPASVTSSESRRVLSSDERREQKQGAHKGVSKLLIGGTLLSVAVGAVFMPAQFTEKVSDLVSSFTASIVGEESETADPEALFQQRKMDKVALFLQQADDYFLAGNIVSPDFKNAIYSYRKVLKIEPNNQAALEGVDKIIAHYARLARKSLIEGRGAEARMFVVVVEKISPRSTVALSLREQLNQSVQLQDRMDELTESVDKKHLQNKVETLLRLAEKDMLEKHWLVPRDDNALLKYRQVLSLDSSNTQALNGLRKLAEHYEGQLNKNIRRGKLNQAEMDLKSLERVLPELDSISNWLGKIERKRAKQAKKRERIENINRLLVQAERLYKVGKYIDSHGKGAFGFYTKVLKLSSRNSKAGAGIAKIRRYYESDFYRRLNDGNIAGAEALLIDFKKTNPNTRVLGEITQALLEAKQPKPPEIDVITGLLGEFKRHFENKDQAGLVSISEMSLARKRFVQQFFGQYRSFKLKISNFQHIGRVHRGVAKARVIGLLNNNGDVVQPGGWATFDVTIKKNGLREWRVYW